MHDYIVPPSDSKGRSSNMSVTVPPAMQRLASIIIQTGTLPFMTVNDVARWCFYHGLIRLEAMSKDENVTGAFSQLALWVKTASVELEQKQYKDHLDRIFGIVDELETAGHSTKSIQMCEMVWQGADRVEDPYWRKVFRARAMQTLEKLKRRRKRRGGTD